MISGARPSRRSVACGVGVRAEGDRGVEDDDSRSDILELEKGRVG